MAKRANFQVTIAHGTAKSERFDMRGFGHGMIRPDGWNAANIGFEILGDDGSWYRMENEIGGTIQLSGVSTAGDAWMHLPDDLVGAHVVRLWSKNVGTDVDVNQTPGVGQVRAIEVMLKA